MTLTVGIDIGGSHITAAVVDLEHNLILPSTLIRQRVDSSADAETIIASWARAIRTTYQNVDLSINLGIAMPGPFNYGDGISLICEQQKYQNLYGLNIKNLLREALGERIKQITFTNDALCFLIGEVKVQNLTAYESILGLTLGTGLGSTYYHNGVFVDADLWNKPFLAGIAEDYFSSRWFTKTCFEQTGIQVNGVQELLVAVTDEDSLKCIFDEFGENLAQFITSIAEERLLQKVILGGNIAKTFNLFAHQLKKIPFQVTCALLGEEAALIGAALAEQKAVSANIDFLTVETHHI